eukprot:jgi/Bigna1/136640/aug1.35_g11348
MEVDGTMPEEHKGSNPAVHTTKSSVDKNDDEKQSCDSNANNSKANQQFSRLHLKSEVSCCSDRSTNIVKMEKDGPKMGTNEKKIYSKCSPYSSMDLKTQSSSAVPKLLKIIQNEVQEEYVTKQKMWKIVCEDYIDKCKFVELTKSTNVNRLFSIMAVKQSSKLTQRTPYSKIPTLCSFREESKKIYEIEEPLVLPVDPCKGRAMFMKFFLDALTNFPNPQRRPETKNMETNSATGMSLSHLKSRREEYFRARYFQSPHVSKLMSLPKIENKCDNNDRDPTSKLSWFRVLNMIPKHKIICPYIELEPFWSSKPLASKAETRRLELFKFMKKKNNTKDGSIDLQIGKNRVEKILPDFRSVDNLHEQICLYERALTEMPSSEEFNCQSESTLENRAKIRPDEMLNMNLHGEDMSQMKISTIFNGQNQATDSFSCRNSVCNKTDQSLEQFIQLRTGKVPDSSKSQFRYQTYSTQVDTYSLDILKTIQVAAKNPIDDLKRMGLLGTEFSIVAEGSYFTTSRLLDEELKKLEKARKAAEKYQIHMFRQDRPIRIKRLYTLHYYVIIANSILHAGIIAASFHHKQLVKMSNQMGELLRTIEKIKHIGNYLQKGREMLIDGTLEKPNKLQKLAAFISKESSSPQSKLVVVVSSRVLLPILHNYLGNIAITIVEDSKAPSEALDLLIEDSNIVLAHDSILAHPTFQWEMVGKIFFYEKKASHQISFFLAKRSFNRSIEFHLLQVRLPEPRVTLIPPELSKISLFYNEERAGKYMGVIRKVGIRACPRITAIEDIIFGFNECIVLREVEALAQTTERVKFSLPCSLCFGTFLDNIF